MEKKKIIFRFVGLFLILSLNLVISANFPAPFVDSGVADVTIVYGNNNPSTGVVQTNFGNNIPITGNVVIENTQDSDKKMWSEKEVCNFIQGCLGKDVCFPYGFRTEKEYCGKDKEFFENYGIIKMKFNNQLTPEEDCNNNFECKSNFCFNTKCVDNLRTLFRDIILRIDNLENSKKEVIQVDNSKEETIQTENVINNSKAEDKDRQRFFQRLFNK